MFERNPITHKLHEYWKDKIDSKFPSLSENNNNQNYLSLLEYIDDSPQKFFSHNVFEIYFDLLNDLASNNEEILIDFFRDHSKEISKGVSNLDEVCKLDIHEQIYTDKEQIELIIIIDEKIHYNFLKLLESTFKTTCLLIAQHLRIKRGKSIEGLDLFNIVEELSKSNRYSGIIAPYDNIIRNGIAHGGVTYSEWDIVYKDKKGNTKSTPARSIIKQFDLLVDICNGIILSIKKFIFCNLELFTKNNLEIPQRILLKELQFQANSPGWELVNCLDSTILNGKKQLILYTKNTFWSYDKVMFFTFRTAVLAEKFASGYERYFFKLVSKNSMNGWAGFDGVKLGQLRQSNASEIEMYKGVLEENLLFFIPKIKFPKFIFKISTIATVFKLNYRIHRAVNKVTNKQLFKIRDTRIHRSGNISVIQDPSVVLELEKIYLREYVRNHYKYIVRKVIKRTKKELGIYNSCKYLRVGFIRVFVYEKDLRKRNLRSSGLIKELVCTIERNRSNKIRTIDIFGSEVEIINGYRIAWNKSWLTNLEN